MEKFYRAIYSVYMDTKSPIPIIDAVACLFSSLGDAIKLNKDLVNKMLADEPRMGGKIIQEDKSDQDVPYWCEIMEVDDNNKPLCLHGYCHVTEVTRVDENTHVYRGYVIEHKNGFYHVRSHKGENCTAKAEFFEALLFIDFYTLIITTNSLLVARNKLVNGGDNND